MIGGESGAYLRYPVGASALAMGGAQSAAPVSCAPWWNPAAMSWEKMRTASVGFGIRSMGQTDGIPSLTFRIPPRLRIGLLVLYRGDPFLNDLYDENEHRLESAAFASFTSKVALSYFVSRKLSAGLGISIFYERIPSGFSDGSVHYSSANGIGFDIALSYRWSERFVIGALLKDAGATAMNWNFESFAAQEDKVLPSFVFGSSLTGTLLGRPLVWNMDARFFLFSGDWKAIERPQVTISNGFEWRYWEKVFLRLGIGELPLNSDIVSDNRSYRDVLSPRISGGLGIDLHSVHEGLRCNYGFSTDRIWAGIDQQLEITYTF